MKSTMSYSLDNPARTSTRSSYAATSCALASLQLTFQSTTVSTIRTPIGRVQWRVEWRRPTRLSARQDSSFALVRSDPGTEPHGPWRGACDQKLLCEALMLLAFYKFLDMCKQQGRKQRQ